MAYVTKLERRSFGELCERIEPDQTVVEQRCEALTDEALAALPGSPPARIAFWLPVPKDAHDGEASPF